MIDEAAVRALDRDDPLAALRSAFVLPEGIIYLDGNSLGVLPVATARRVARVIEEEWGRDLIQSWNRHDWIGMPRRVGDRIARLIGADEGEVLAVDSASVNLLKLLWAALPMRPGRRVILSDDGNFPNDLYIAEGLTAALAGDHVVKIVAPDEVAGAIDDTVAVLMLTEVDYRTGRRHDMTMLTQRAHAAGALVLCDLCHSAGATDLSMRESGIDLAVGCGYKYLNGGPGAPAFMYVAARHQLQIKPAVSGWMGHRRPFAFDLRYQPAAGIARHLAGTPSIVSMAALDAALDVFDRTDMAAIRAKSLALGDLFIALADDRLASHGLQLVTPRAHALRGSQISLRHGDGYAIVQALIAAGVVGDFREPDILRFGLTPLYTSYMDIWNAVRILETVMVEDSYNRPEFTQRALVT